MRTIHSWRMTFRQREAITFSRGKPSTKNGSGTHPSSSASTGMYLHKFFISAEPYERSVSLGSKDRLHDQSRHSICVIHTIPYKQTRFERVTRPASLCYCACGFIRACSPEPAPAQGLSACSATENCRSRTTPRVGSRIDRAWSDGDG